VVERAKLSTKGFRYSGPAKLVLPIIIVGIVGYCNFHYESRITGFPESTAAFVLCAIVVFSIGLYLCNQYYPTKISR